MPRSLIKATTPLKPKEKEFILNYLENGNNATQAVVETWPKTHGDPGKRLKAAKRGYKLIHQPHIASYLRSLSREQDQQIREAFHDNGFGLDRRVAVTAGIGNKGSEFPAQALRAVEIANKMEGRFVNAEGGPTTNILAALVVKHAGVGPDNRDEGPGCVYSEVPVDPDEVAWSETVQSVAYAGPPPEEHELEERPGPEVQAGRVQRLFPGTGFSARALESVPQRSDNRAREDTAL